jgi:predicted O-methyltransferase YrrM
VSFGIDIGLDGYLARAEAMKLYELAYFGSGDVLELGTYMGLSASIVGNALRNRGDGELHTCDISTVYSRTAQQCLKWHPARPFIHFHTGDAPTFLDRMIAQQRTFGLIFVDHWHSYEQTHEVAIRLPRLVRPGGFAMFHDYNDPSARDPAHPHKVFQAVRDGLDQDMFQSCCVAASSAVFQRRP